MWPFTASKPKPKATAMTGPETPAIRALSLVGPEEFAGRDALPPQAFLGHLENDAVGVETFRPNPKFIEFMHEVIKRAGPADREMQEAAVQQQTGYLYIIDLRTPDGPQGEVPTEDIVGAFEVRDGMIVAQSYWANEDHRLMTKNGIVQLPPTLQAALETALREL